MEHLLSPELLKITESISDAGGHCFLVGGFVRDALLDIQSKDVDIEVFGLSLDKIQAALPKSAHAEAVGVQFGVLKIRLHDGQEVDISIPRRDSKVGVGHTGFLMEFDSSMTTREASQRRDFTFNSIMFDMETKRFVDHHGGAPDLQMDKIRHTSSAFSEDPLRVLRAFQFAARFNFHVASETLELCKSLLPEFETLSKERIWAEWEKIGRRGTHFRHCFNAIRDSGWDSKFPGLSERSVERFNIAAAACVPEGITGERRLVVVLAALVDSIDAWKREEFLRSINAPREICNQIRKLITHQSIGAKNAEVQARQLARQLAPMTIRDATCFGGVSGEVRIAARLAKVFNGPETPFVTGSDIIARGVQPSPIFKPILHRSVELQDLRLLLTREEALAWLDTELSKPVELET